MTQQFQPSAGQFQPPSGRGGASPAETTRHEPGASIATPAEPTPGAAPVQEEGPHDGSRVDRGMLILEGLRGGAAWAWRFLLVVAALGVLFYLVGKVWVGVLPIALALIVSTVLLPPVRWLTRLHLPRSLAALLVLLVAVASFVGILIGVAPSVASQTQQVVTQAAEGLDQVREWLTKPPLNLQNEQLDQYLSQGTKWLEEQASSIAGTLFSGVSRVSSMGVTTMMVIVLTFFFLKDGPSFLPWLRRATGRMAGLHLTEALTRCWDTLGGFIRAQAIVSLIDAVFIGAGLLLLKVPLAFVLALITFIAGFIPIIGAVIAGVLAVLVALVSSGFMTAVWVAVLVMAVQQLEGNILSPMLQSRAMQMHPAIILFVVAAGGTRWGIVGAFLAVPVAACIATIVRYVSEHLDLRTGERAAASTIQLTPEGRLAAEHAESNAPVFALRAAQAYRQAEDQRGAAREALVDRTTSFAQTFRDKLLTPRLRREDGEHEDAHLAATDPERAVRRPEDVGGPEAPEGSRGGTAR